ncbi:hypothetical protein BXU11_09650 [Flavobacterium sp. LM5]|nr:hypothetical protein BXU11_09650 [Flavobacterium sp. LM5]
MPVVAAIAGGATTVCVGATTAAFTNTTAGGTWTIANGTGTATINASGVVSGVTAGTVTVEYTVTTSGCSTKVTTPLTINALPVVAAIAGGATTVCVGATTAAFTNTTAGGTWTIVNGTGTATINASGVVSGVTAGTVTVEYTVTTSGCSTKVTTPLTINALPVVAAIAGGATTVCVGATTAAFTNTTAGGTWTIANGTGTATINASGVVSGVTAGTVTVEYTVTTSGCSTKVTTPLTINALPVVAAIAGGATTVCVGATTAAFTNTTAGGTWTIANGTGTATINASGVVSGVTAGTVTVEYTVTTSGCSTKVTTPLTINALPVVAAIAGGATTVCVGATTAAFTNTTAGGTWTIANGTGTATINASGVVSGVTAGTVTVEYTVTTSGCSTKVTTPLTINALPVVAAIAGGATTVCVGATTAAFTNTTAGGTWTIANGTGTATINASGVVSGVTAGTVTVEYTVTTSGCSTKVTTPLTINALPVVAAIAGGATTVCVGATTAAFTNTTAGGTWTIANGTGTATINASGVVSGVTAGTVTVEYTVTTSGCSTKVTTPLTINALPVVAAIAGGATTVCVGATTAAFTNTTAGGTWTIANGTGTATINASGVVSGVTAGTVTVEYTVTTSGCSTKVTTPLTINALPVVAAIAGGATTVCVGATTAAFTNTTAGGTWTIANGTGTATINASGVVSGVTAGTVTVEYTVTTSGCSTKVTTPLTINALPVVAAIAGGATTVCVGATTAAFTNTTAGGTWTIANGTGTATINASGVVSGVTAGTVTVEYTVTTSGCSTKVTTPLTINALPAKPTASATLQPTCAVVAGTITITAPTGVGMTYSIDGSTYTNTTGVFNLLAAGTYSVTAKSSEGCVSLASDPIVISNVICAQDDTISGGNGTTGTSNAGNVLGNNPTNPDTLNGTAVVIGLVNLTVTTPAASKVLGAPVPSIDVATGQVSVPTNTPAGDYTIVYEICEKLNPTNCESATVTVKVEAPTIVAQDDTISGGNGTTGTSNAGNVLGNNPTNPDTLNGTAVVIGLVNLTVTTPAAPKVLGAPVPSIDVATGQVSVPTNTPAGDYTIVYEICEKLNPTNCESATVTVKVEAPTIVAQDDTISGGNGTTGTSNAGNVLGNNPTNPDTLNGTAVVIGLVNLTVTTPAAPKVLGAPVPSIDVATGQVSVPTNTPAGDYTIVYEICEKLNPTNCESATVTVKVEAPTIVAQDDTISGGNGTTGTSNAGNVLGNNPTNPDTLNGTAVVIGLVNLTVTTPAAPKVLGAPVPSIDVATGQVSVPTNTPAGDYTIVYEICEKLNPTNCESATVTVKVEAPTIVAQDDTISGGNGTTGTSNAGNVLGNNPTNPDTLNGTAVVIGLVNLTVTTPAASKVLGAPVPSIDVATGQVSVPTNTPAGDYTIVYEICEKLNPTNCESATVTLTVTAPTIDAVTETTVVINGLPGGTTATLLANDTVNGNPVVIGTNPGQVTLTSVNVPSRLTLNADGTVTVDPNTPAGNYNVEYKICEVNNPLNCDIVTSIVVVGVAEIIAKNDEITVDNTIKEIKFRPFNSDYGNGFDTLDGKSITFDQITVTVTDIVLPGGQSFPVPKVDSLTKEIVIPASVPAGVYTIFYTICEKLNPTNCSDATITITVKNPVVKAEDDILPTVIGTIGSSNAGNVLEANSTKFDTINGVSATTSLVNISIVSPALPVVNGALVPVLNTTTGNVEVPKNTPAGIYTIAYSICDKINPTVCDEAIVTIKVAAIEAADDGLYEMESLFDKTIASVLLNDTLDGVVLTPETYNTITLTPISVPAGFTLRNDGSIEVKKGMPADTYTIVYEICTKKSPIVCDQATVRITVVAPIITATNDDYSNQPINSSKGAVLDVLVNDRINNGSVNSVQVVVSIVDSNGVAGVSVDAQGKITIPVGTPVGTYVLTYSICDVINPNNCATATVTIVVKDPCDFDDSDSSCDILVHNAFSPNNDGDNQVFTIDRIENYPENTVEIYNRWGVLVFEVEGYDNTSKVFVGISEGRVTVNKADALPNGTYYYVVKYKKPLSGVMKQKAGFLYLSR